MKISGVRYFLVLFVVVCFCCPVSAAADAGYFSGGAGTADDPYLIATPSDLLNLSRAVNGWEDGGRYAGCAYRVTAPLNLSGISGWVPVGTRDSYFPTDNATLFWFRGVFDGGFQPITGLTGSHGERVGLLGHAEGAVLKNICLEQVTAESGGLVRSASSTRVENCSVSGTVSGYPAGMLIGWGRACDVRNCSVSGSVTGVMTGGGIAGRLENSTVQYCTAAVSVTGDGFEEVAMIGGLTGFSEGCVITDSFFTGDLVNEDGFAGGLAGFSSDDRYLRCGATGNMTGSARVGGLAGEAGGSVFTDCFAAGNVSAVKGYAGGLAGTGMQVNLSCCYAAMGSISGFSGIGAVAGEFYGGSVTDCVVLSSQVTGSQNVSALFGTEDPQFSGWPVTLSNVSVWDEMQAGDMQSLPDSVSRVSSADVWETAPGSGVWRAFSAEVWTLPTAADYRLPVLLGTPAAALPDVSFLRSGPAVPGKTESPVPLAGVVLGCAAAVLLRRRFA